MVTAVNTVATQKPVVPVVQKTDTTTSTTTPSLTAQNNQSGSGTLPTNTLSSRLFVDSTAGGILVSEQLNSNGSIAAQTPSSSVLAYLQNGLTIDGFPKQSTTA